MNSGASRAWTLGLCGETRCGASVRNDRPPGGVGRGRLGRFQRAPLLLDPDAGSAVRMDIVGSPAFGSVATLNAAAMASAADGELTADAVRVD